MFEWTGENVYDFGVASRGDECLGGPSLEVDIRTMQQEQWSIASICIFVVIGSSLLLDIDISSGMVQLVLWKGVLDVIVVHRLT